MFSVINSSITAALALLSLGAFYTYAVPINPLWGDFWQVMGLVALIGSFLFGLAVTLRHEDRIGEYMVKTMLVIVVGAVLFNLMFSSVVLTDSYRSLLGTPQAKGPTLPALDIRKAGLVPEDAARKAAETLLSNDPGLGSQVSVGQLVKQLVNGELVYVAFLEHKGWRTWFANNTTPGYVIVSAHDASHSKLVLGRNLRYLDSGYFGDNIERKAWANSLTTQFTDFTSELDDAGQPYWAATILERSVPFGPEQIAGALVINAETGTATRYGLNDLPAWLDRVQPAQKVAHQVNYWGDLVHGIINSWFAKKDVLHVASFPDLVYGEDGKAYWFVELAASGRNSGINGFLLVDSRTKAATHYQVAGASQNTAETVIHGLYPEKNYTLGTALPFMVGGEPAYVAPLYKGNVIRGYGLVAMKDYQIVAGGETLEGAVRAYLAKLHKTEASPDQAPRSITVKGTVARFAADTRNGNTTYLLTVMDDKRLFVGSADVAETLPLTTRGDLVELKAEGEATAGTLTLSGFSNSSL